MDWAVGEHWSYGAQPWHHSSRLDDHFSPDPPECRHSLNRAVGEHWRSAAYHSHHSLRLNAHIRPALAERRHRAYYTRPAPRRHSTQSRRRIPLAETEYRRPNTLSRHNRPWLDAHSRMALVGGWHIAHRAMSAYWRHCALAPHNTVPDQYCVSFGKHGELTQVYRLTPPISPCAPSKKCLGLPLVPVALPYLISPPLSSRCLQIFLGVAIFPSLCPGSLAFQYLFPSPGVQNPLLLVTTLLGPFLVGSSVTVFFLF
jgi:hypothetical protein